MRFAMKKIAVSLLTLALVGCSGQSAMMPMNNQTMNPALMGRAPLGALNAASAEAQIFTAHFVNAYRGPVAENEPTARRDPNGPAQALIKLINGARQTLDGAFYDIGSEEAVAALIAAQQRGVRVRIVTDTDNMTERDTGRNGPTRGVIAKLQQAGIPVVDDKRSGIMHHKFLIADNQAVWMGSTNLTNTSMYQHNNNALTIRVPQITANYNYEFERMFTQKVFGPQPPRQIPHPVVKVGNTTIQTFFSPKGGGREALLDVANKAQKRLHFMTFSFTDKDIANVMVQKRQAGVWVDGIFDRCLGFGQYSAYHLLRQGNVISRMDGNQALLHHKIMLADDTVVTGSFNFSSNADNSNNENMLIIQNSYVAGMYRQEYERIMNAAKTNNPPQGECPGQKPAPQPGTPVDDTPISSRAAVL
jgi:phosphatidylserine/phosphatidylglycerophosphate/cardiolipin synthase-like enzyme